MLSKACELEISSEDSKLWPDSLDPEDAEQCRREVKCILIQGWAIFVTPATVVCFCVFVCCCVFFFFNIYM